MKYILLKHIQNMHFLPQPSSSSSQAKMGYKYSRVRVLPRHTSVDDHRELIFGIFIIFTLGDYKKIKIFNIYVLRCPFFGDTLI